MNTHLRTDDKKIGLLKEIFLLYFIILFIWTAYRMFLTFPEWIDECVAKPLVWLGPLIYLQRSKIKWLIQSKKPEYVKNATFGFLAGVLYFIIYTALSRVSTGFPLFNPDRLTSPYLLLQVIIAVFTGFVEEIIFRRYILEKSLLLFHDSIIANSFSSFLFTFIHLPIILFVYKYPLPIIISYLLLLFISGFIYGLVYLKNKSLIASTMTHAMWNFLGTIIR